jgi:3-hydroxyacyl-CoA dehydrogenase
VSSPQIKPKTGPRGCRTALTFYTAIGKQPIYIRREVPGHVANRYIIVFKRGG